MTTTTNTEHLKYDEKKFSLIVDEILGFAWNTNFVSKVNNLSPTKLHNDVLRDNSAWDKKINFIVNL